MAKNRAQCINEALCFVSISVQVESLMLRNPLLRQTSNVIVKQNRKEMEKSVSQKLGINENMRTFLLNAPEKFSDEIKLPNVDLQTKLTGEFDYIHFFVVTQKEFHENFKNLKTHLKTTGILWVSWPKSGQNETDLNIKTVIKIGYDYGLVESKTISINSIWSALKFTYPKEGKKYNNSYGKLK